MRWGEHLIGAIFVGILAVIIFELLTGNQASKIAAETFSAFNVSTGLAIAILVLVTLGVWAKTSRG